MDNYFIERKQHSDTLIIAFTGHANALMMDAFEFFSVTNALNCNRILIRDPSKRVCLRGIGGEINSAEKLVHQLKSDIKTITPKFITVIGTSGGGYSAILFGHLLKANFVHAFGPTTHIHPVSLSKNLPLKNGKKNYKLLMDYYILIMGLYMHPKIWKFLDLKSVLARYNGITQYNIYICEGYKRDVVAANYLKDCKNLRILEQPCDVHNVVRCMIKNQKLMTILTNNADKVVES